MEFGAWNFSGAWSLVLGILHCPRHSPPAPLAAIWRWRCRVTGAVKGGLGPLNDGQWRFKKSLEISRPRPGDPKRGYVNPRSEKSEVKLDQETPREAMRGFKKVRSHLINGSRWRGQRFWLATRRDAGRIPAAGFNRGTTNVASQKIGRYCCCFDNFSI